MLTQEQLNKLSTQRLINVLRLVRVKERIASKSLVCDCCGEYLGNKFQDEYAKALLPIDVDYSDRIKDILKTREHMNRKKAV